MLVNRIYNKVLNTRGCCVSLLQRTLLKSLSTNNTTTNKDNFVTKPLLNNLSTSNTTINKDNFVTRLTALPSGAALLGFSGAIPFASLAVASTLTNQYADVIAQGQISYAACILTFLGGVHWGKELMVNKSAPDTRILAYSVLPSLYAWTAFALPYNIALYYLSIGLFSVAVYDVNDKTLPQWYRTMRIPLTTVAATSVLLTGYNH